MIAGVTHLTAETALPAGIATGRRWGFEPQFTDQVALPAAFEAVEVEDHRLPLALLTGPAGIALELVRHRRTSGRRSAWTGLLRSAPDRAGIRTAVPAALRRSGLLRHPARIDGTPGGEAFADLDGREAGLAGLLCTVGEVRADAEFWTAFAHASFAEATADGGYGTVPSPLPGRDCPLVLVPAAEPGPVHAMNDHGFPSIGVFSTSIEADFARALTLGAELRAEPIAATVGGRALTMALIVTPGGAPVELLSAARRTEKRGKS